METSKLNDLQKLYEEGLITEEELKKKREKIISEIINNNSLNEQKSQSNIASPYKENKFKKGIIIVLAIFLGLIIIASMYCNIEDSEILAENEVSGQTTNNTNLKLGKWYQLNDKYKIKITSLKYVNYLEYDTYVFQPAEGNTYIAVYFSYKNISDVPIKHLNATDELKNFQLKSPNGMVYNSSFWPSAILAYEELSFMEKLEFQLNNGINRGNLEPYSVGKDVIGIEAPKSIIKEDGWKVIVNELEFAL